MTAELKKQAQTTLNEPQIGSMREEVEVEETKGNPTTDPSQTHQNGVPLL